MTGPVRWLTCDRGDVSDGLDWLAPDERARLDTLRFAARRADFLLGRWTAKRLIAGVVSGARLAAIAIRAAADGAPEAFLDGAPLPLTVSLSHRAGRALAAVGDTGAPLGADLELIEPRSALLVADFFTAAEAAEVATCPRAARDRAIALIWSAKESALKARRTGLREDPRRIRVEADGIAQPSGAPGDGAWHALRIAVDGGPELAGWWRDDAGHVLTIAGATLAADPPRPAWHHRPRDGCRS
jgi:4'-phosphopantetheinyl transferase